MASCTCKLAAWCGGWRVQGHHSQLPDAHLSWSWNAAVSAWRTACASSSSSLVAR